MHGTLGGIDLDRLERSCGPRGDTIRLGTGAKGLERAEVYLSTVAFEPHRHDTYAVGVTTVGVQTFRYRGARRICLPGQVHVLCPDEVHDGGAGTDDGFGYRILYLSPALVAEALGGRPLPFVANPVPARSATTERLASLLGDVDEPVGELRLADIVADVADSLRTLAGDRGERPGPVDKAAMNRVREYLDGHPCGRTSAATLERIAGIDRFTVARQFRRAFGTSPDRYRLLRRLEVGRSAIEAGCSLARAAADAGFADQSHMTRQFKRAYGLTPGRWAAATAARTG
jgi:AraC-like DNA-binding protein